MNTLKLTAAVSGFALMASAASAVPVVYTGYDVGANSLAAAPNAQAASDAFDLAVGATSLTDFEAGPSTDFTFSAGNRENTLECGFALCGGNTTAGGEWFHRVDGGSTTITFASAISAFGAYFSGWQIGTQTITYTDGDTVVLEMGDANLSDGGLRFFGFQDTGASIASITYTANGDIVALDDVRIDAAIPVPASLPLLLAGIGGLAALRRRKTKKA